MAEFLKQVRINLDLGKNQIKNLVIDKEKTAPSSPVVGQIYFDTQKERYGVYLGSEEGKGWQYFATIAELEKGLSEKQNNLRFEDGSPLSLAGDKKDLLQIAKSTAIAAADLASDSKVATEKAVRDLHNGIPAEAMTLTNKAFDAKGTGNSLSNVTAANFDVNGLSLGTDETKDNAVLPSLKKVEALVTAATPDATEAVAGKARLATQAEALAGTDDTTIITPAKLHYAIEQNIKGAVTYKGSFANQTELEAFEPIHVGDLFVASAACDVGSKHLNQGDWAIFRTAVSDSTALTGAEFDVIDSTDEEDIVRLDAIQVLKNKTISADNNTISDLETDNFKANVIQTSVRNAAQASDTALATEKAVRTAINTASPHVDEVTLEAYTATEGDAFKTLRVKDGGLTVDKFNASDLSLGASEAQGAAVLVSQQKVTEDIEDFRTATKTLTNKTLDLATSGEGAGNNVITNAQVGIFAKDVVRKTVRVAGTADDDSLATEAAVRAAVNNVASDTMTLTNKTFDANGTGNSLSNVEVADFAKDVVVTSTPGIAPVATASDTKLVTEKAVATKLDALSASELQIKSVGLTFADGVGDKLGTSSCTVSLIAAGFKSGHPVSSAKVVDADGNEVECLISYVTDESAPAVVFQINGAASSASNWKAIIVA